MPGKRITDQQRRLYMEARSKGKTQKIAAAQAGFCERLLEIFLKIQAKRNKLGELVKIPFKEFGKEKLVREIA